MQQRDQWNIQHQECGTTKPLYQIIHGTKPFLFFRKYEMIIENIGIEALLVKFNCLFTHTRTILLAEF